MKFESLLNLKTLIRTDSSALIGHGHIRRDLVLATKFKDISFACLPLNGNLIDEIKYPVFTLQNGDINELIDIINEQNFELVIIDHYGIDAKDEKAIKERTDAFLMSFDDNYKRHFCDAVLNVNLYADTLRYATLTPPDTQIYAGREYLLVRDEFYVERDIKREKIYDFFIGLGGTDVLNLSAKIAQNLLDKNYKIAIITTSANTHLNELLDLEKRYKNLNIFINSNEIAKLMNKSRELIISASSMVNEAIVLGAKFKAIKTADNQNEIYQWLKDNNYEVYESDEVCANL
ncbi:UDP-2,4-diacetamido-2,4,6-trideoxy-beta-L-altropyranose hydrolase [Campylobacter sp. faydin G-140]|uniref:UDP-2,4-diacetamido-2,4, 6-trideoxy-beta-L-altropyranose hydrolase n=1 Tax=Campylobacter anatolicus TaxID=2829105 RepID=UPI001B9F25DD|nr:UDP-2,4-diacetamido-2,4,6-trideoxy-beta-L-altropyranose hydrolase [Campylobacter anatolicus]MBR8465386.1 UDP-2,4-diacetamido-2,4,6-trideoxy-beta-L-altropyranose hydrolase [Campylobacter anatolicus]